MMVVTTRRRMCLCACVRDDTVVPRNDRQNGGGPYRTWSVVNLVEVDGLAAYSIVPVNINHGDVVDGSCANYSS